MLIKMMFIEVASQEFCTDAYFLHVGVCSKQIWIWKSGRLFLDECGLPLYINVDVIQIPLWAFFMRGDPFTKSTFELSLWIRFGDVALMAVLTIMRMVAVTVTVIMIVMVMNLVMRWSWWCVIIMMVWCADCDGDGHGEDDRWSWCWW